MKKFASNFGIVLIAAILVFILLSCSQKASNAIVGKWQVQGQKDTLEFRKDRTVVNSHDVTAGPPGGTRTFTEQSQVGTYAFTDGSHMNLQRKTGDTNQPTVSIRCEVHIHGDRMDMTM